MIKIIIISTTIIALSKPIRAAEILEKAKTIPHTATPDCIFEHSISDFTIRIKTKNGKQMIIYKDKLGRATSVKLNNRILVPTYDSNIPNKIVAFEISNNEITTTVLVPIQTTPPSKEAVEKIKSAAAKFHPCSAEDRTAGHILGDGAENNDLALIDQSWYGENWGDAGFYAEYADEYYWENIDMPIYASSRDEEMYKSKLRDCLNLSSACNDGCDFASDARGLSCLIGVVAFMEIPIGATLYGIACYSGGWNAKLNCKASCTTISSCL